MSTIKRIEPEGLLNFKGLGFTQVTEARGNKTIFVSGQVSIDETGQTVGKGDIVAQTHQVMKNLGMALAGANAGYTDLAKITVFIVDYDPAQRMAILAARNEYIPPDIAPASTLIGVSALAAPDYLIEIEAVAVID